MGATTAHTEAKIKYKMKRVRGSLRRACQVLSTLPDTAVFLLLLDKALVLSRAAARVERGLEARERVKR